MDILPLAEAVDRLRTDHHLVLARTADLSDTELAADYRLAGGPLGDFCDSLHDLASHVLMWDEINLAVLSEALAGRAHWSLDSRWETPDAGQRLNRGGIAAGRHVPVDLLLHRLRTVRDALLDELSGFSQQTWTEPGTTEELSGGIGALAQRVWTVPGQPAFWHAAVHLGELPAGSGTAGR